MATAMAKASKHLQMATCMTVNSCWCEHFCRRAVLRVRVVLDFACACANVYTHLHTFVHICTHLYTFVHILYAFAHMCTHLLTFLRICTHLCTYLYTCVRMCTHLYIPSVYQTARVLQECMLVRVRNAINAHKDADSYIWVCALTPCTSRD